MIWLLAEESKRSNNYWVSFRGKFIKFRSAASPNEKGREREKWGIFIPKRKKYTWISILFWYWKRCIQEMCLRTSMPFKSPRKWETLWMRCVCVCVCWIQSWMLLLDKWILPCANYDRWQRIEYSGAGFSVASHVVGMSIAIFFLNMFAPHMQYPYRSHIVRRQSLISVIFMSCKMKWLSRERSG